MSEFRLRPHRCSWTYCTLAPFDPNDDETTPLRHHPKTRLLVCHWTILLSGIEPFEIVAHWVRTISLIGNERKRDDAAFKIKAYVSLKLVVEYKIISQRYSYKKYIFRKNVKMYCVTVETSKNRKNKLISIDSNSQFPFLSYFFKVFLHSWTNIMVHKQYMFYHNQPNKITQATQTQTPTSAFYFEIQNRKIPLTLYVAWFHLEVFFFFSSQTFLPSRKVMSTHSVPGRKDARR